MNRRSFLKSAGGVAASTAVAIAQSKNAARPPRQVIVILGESVRYDMLNCNKATGLKTPNLDRLAEGGVCFDRAYNCQPVCAPARSAVWTGLPPHANRVVTNSIDMGNIEHTIGQRLHDRGIHCALIGKWHLSGTDYFDTGKPAPGWDPDYWYDMRTYLSELSPEDRVRSRSRFTANDPKWTKEFCYAYRVTNRALDFLQKSKNDDFMLAVCYDEPHSPSLCPIEYSKMYEDYEFPGGVNLGDTLQGKPAHQWVWAGNATQHKPVRFKSSRFFGSHTFVDHEIGRILDQIDATSPNALVIYTSDHGVFLHNHHMEDKGPVMYEEITHVPFIVRWPGHAPAKTRSSSLVSHVDLAGTLMSYFGFEIPKTTESKDLLPVFQNPSQEARDAVFIEWTRFELDHDGFGGFQPIRCICDGRYKLTINLMVTDELYDLEQDPAEMHNLIDSQEHAAIRNSLHDRLLQEMNVSRDPDRGYYWWCRAWRPEFTPRWDNSGMTRQRESDGYLPRELDYDTGLTMTSATRAKKV